MKILKFISSCSINSYKSLLLLFLTIFLTDLIHAVKKNPLKDGKICGRPQCETIDGKFSYTNKVYKYDYIVELGVEFAGSGTNTSNLSLKADLEFHFPTLCEGFLRINQVRLWDKAHVEEGTASTFTSTSFQENNIYDYYDELEKAESFAADDNRTGEHPKSENLANDLKENVLRFAFHDGLISEVCATSDEPNWVLNFKKGILSAFQNTMLRFDIDYDTIETDVSGTCHVKYTLQSTDNVFIIIHKTKYISTCQNRYSTQSILQTTPYTFRDDKTIWPILDSQSYCNMTIDNNIYRDVTCIERHQLIPFSNATSGTVTTAMHKLIFKTDDLYRSESGYFPKENELIVRRSTLLFDHTPNVKPTHGEIKASREHLKEMCSLGFPKIQREFIDAFTRFIQTVKHLDYTTLNQLLARSASICENGKKHVLESLPYIGSTASYQVMRDQILENMITRRMALGWMTSLSFIQRPDEETLETFYTILEFSRQKLDPEYTLCASAVIHSFCRHVEDCNRHAKVLRILYLLETDFLNYLNMYRGERRSLERMIILLKSIGNIGVITETLAAQLKDLITNDSKQMMLDLRLQSILAFRRINCQEYRQFFLNTYSNYTMNSEIRILSYLQVMRCPDYAIINEIKMILKEEKVNQVGSFVWSHLKNLAKSTSPIRMEAQGLLFDDDLSDKFKLDIRKFSRNYEHSIFFDEYNFGTTTDFNLIFGINSYVPRLVTLNFTTELFGQSVNFFDFSARLEGFEGLIGSIFGPKGPLNRALFRKRFSFLNRWLGNESLEDMDTLSNLLSIDTLRFKRNTVKDEESAYSMEIDDADQESEVEEEKNNEDNIRRNRRSHEKDVPVKRRKQQIMENINRKKYKLNYDYNNPRAQLAIRIFGNDLSYYSIEGMSELMALSKEFDVFYQISKILSGREITYTKSCIFLDATYTVPLDVGLPLSVNAFGASSIDLRISGGLDRTEPSIDWHFDLEGKFKPSISVDIITTVQIDLFHALAGVKVKGNLYSNSEIEAKLKVRGKNLIVFSFDLPQDTNEVFSAKSELIVLAQNEEEIPQAGIVHRRSNDSCTWDVLDKAIGLQLCSHFSVPDLVQPSPHIYPSLLLSGPTNFSIVLKKSDPTAKRYSFQYNWDQSENITNWSMLFYTPGSSVKRLLVGNVTMILNTFNMSLTFLNGENKTSAGCNYIESENNRQLEVFLDTNNNRSLEMKMNLKRWKEQTTWIYEPKVLLTVNGVNITGLIGTIRIVEKNGIIQKDFDISFETKKLQALLRGNYVQNEVTTTTNITINYRFQANEIETINFESKLLNTGDKSKTEYHSFIKLETSAYPKINFASNGTWLSLQAHTEGSLTYNNAPDLMDPTYTSTIRLIFVRLYTDEYPVEECHTRASIELKVPRSKIYFRVSIKHEEKNKNGAEHNVILGAQYAPDKETTALFSIHLPRKNLFGLDIYMNITVPEFNSCASHIKINEIKPKVYLINYNGSWFTGHLITIKTKYEDKSSRLQALQHIKLIAESPSFKPTAINVIYRRNQMLLFVDIQVRYAADPYRLIVQGITNAMDNNCNAKLQLKIRDKDYWINAKLLSEIPKLLEIEIHLDKLRDIFIKLSALNMKLQKELSLDFQWDANRNPSQRLALLADFKKIDSNRFDTNLMITYPERTISCGFEGFTGGPHYYGTARVGWNVNEIIIFNYKAGLMPLKDNIHSWLRAELLTPFQNWKSNNLGLGIYTHENLILANISMLWGNNQDLELSVRSDYEITDDSTSFDIYIGLNSTIHDIPTINLKFKHWQDMKKFDTYCKLRYSNFNKTLNVYSIKSLWEVSEINGIHNITGTLLILSPHEGYRKGSLATKFSYNDRREIQGAASLDFDMRECTLAIEGYVRKLLDNMLTVNITTPLERFRTVHARLGLSERKRHVVAEVRSPRIVLGIEILLDIISMMDFNVKLSLATPLENFHQAALIAKLQAEAIDFRTNWNNATLGFVGVWHMEDATNFEYMYTVYTPLAGFEENGIVIKFIKTDVFILHLHGKVSKYKLGFKLNGVPKSKILNQLGGNKVELEILYDDDFQPSKFSDTTDDYDINDIDYNEYFSYYFDFELDTITWPTIIGVIDVQEIMDFYLIVGNVQLPQGQLAFKDRLYYPDYINVLNVFTLTTPFRVAKEIKSVMEYHVDLNFNYLYDKIQFLIIGGEDHISRSLFGIELNYTKIEDEVKPKHHVVNINIETPLSALPYIILKGTLQLEETFFSGNLSSKTNTSYISFGTALEIEENFLEASIDIGLNNVIIPPYGYHGYVKKDFTEKENLIIVHFKVLDNNEVNELYMESMWKKDLNHLINGYGKITTTIIPLKMAETTILITNGPNPKINLNVNVWNWNGKHIQLGTIANKKDETFNVEMWTPISEYRNISMHGSIKPIQHNSNKFQINGNIYRNMITYYLNGTVQITDNYPSDLILNVHPIHGQSTRSESNVIQFTIDKRVNAASEAYKVKLNIIESSKTLCQISGSYALNHESQDMDVTTLIQSGIPDLKRINFIGHIKNSNNDRVISSLALETPWSSYGIDSVNINLNYCIQKLKGELNGEYRIGDSLGQANYEWTWRTAEDVQLFVKSFIKQPNSDARFVSVTTKYLNPNGNFQHLEIGGNIDADSKWMVDMKSLTNYMSSDDVNVNLIAILPKPVSDTHNINVRYRGNIISKQGTSPEIFVEGKYRSQNAKRDFLSRIAYRNTTDIQGLARTEWGQFGNISIAEGDFQILRKSPTLREFYAKLTTPIYEHKDTIYVKGIYDINANNYHKLSCALEYPSGIQFADLNVSFESFSNMYGYMNSTTPFLNNTWFKGDFNFTTTQQETYRYCKTIWPSDTALFKFHNTYNRINYNNAYDNGTLQIEVPLITRHVADITFHVNESSSIENGFLKVLYNGQKVLDSSYKSIDDRSQHLIRVKTLDMKIENDLKPLGVHYVHKLDASYPMQLGDKKHLEIFELNNATNFNLTGELHSIAHENGQELKLLAIHPNRTVEITTSYESFDDDRTMKYHSKLKLSENVWIGYNIMINNSTTIDKDSGKFSIDLFYPKRSLFTEGSYILTEDKLLTDLTFKWTKPETYTNENKKMIRTGLVWQMMPLHESKDKDHQTVVVTISHPDLEKDVTLKAEYYRGLIELLRTSCLIDYSNDEDHLIEAKIILKNLRRQLGHYKYLLYMTMNHMASELMASLNGTVTAQPSFYETKLKANYKRSYTSEKFGEFLSFLDMRRKELVYLRAAPARTVKFALIPIIKYPIYGLNGTFWDTPEINNTGYLYIDLEKKIARSEFNLTEDGTQNLQLIGHVPDSRSAFLEVWRNYEEIRVIDISSYIKMNHSRLISGRFHWQPQITSEMRRKFRAIGSTVYNSIAECIDFWITSLYEETMETVSLVWETAKAYNDPFFHDLEDLKTLGKDLEEFRHYLNQSYEANDFYLKTLVNFTSTIIDELAIRNHIESLPQIFSEIWQAMGDSGKALRNNIVWLVKTIKDSYNNFLQSLNRFFSGESLHYLSDLMSKAVHKYDRFIKDLHISFIKYVENLWFKFWNMMSNYWKNILKRLEPHLFKFISYVETAAWNLSKEVFDFIYKRTNELAESPYFNKVSSFTQDLDNLYKDIKSHDAITNIKKYSVIIWNFLKEKYFKLVPFGLELNEIFSEIWEEIKELQKIQQVAIFIHKYNALKVKIAWLTQELQMEKRLYQLYSMIANKLRHYTNNALETADMYREAKTKFIFDPEIGIIDMEQKLPMSWHAFNETPRFEEIPEYKILTKVYNLFTFTNTSLIRYIYNLRQHFDPKTWLPPYQARSLLIGSRHYVTFDKRFVALNACAKGDDEKSCQDQHCSYLMAHDFSQSNFTLTLQPSLNGTKLNFIANDQLIEIDFERDRLTINGDNRPMLPIQIGLITIYRELDILTITSDTEFNLICNMQYVLCWMEVSGWYFGKTAGILGTINNEHYDDFITPDHYVQHDINAFTRSWNLENDCNLKVTTNQLPALTNDQAYEKSKEICDDYFKSGILSACADTLDVTSYYEICLDLGWHYQMKAIESNNNSPVNKGACTAALAYIEACSNAHIPLRVPEQCIACQLNNNSYISEGKFVTLNSKDILRSSDIVFIIEAKPCNANLTIKKNIMAIAMTLEQQLLSNHIINNRYGVMAFGSKIPFDVPRTIYYDNSEFTTDIRNLMKHFSYIETGNGSNNDILQAISMATRLKFRPGVSKIFILLACTNCASQNMRLDYTSIRQYMREEGISLHILADAEFEFERSKKLRHFFGLDKEFIYSKRFPEGDRDIRQQLRLTKNDLGVCVPLALETNGAVFSAKKLLPERKYPIKRFATIFAKRIVKSILDLIKLEQTCECSGHNTGMSYMACSPKINDTEDKSLDDDYDLLQEFDDLEFGDNNEMILHM